MDKILFLFALVLGIGGDILWAYIANRPKRRGKKPISFHVFNYHIHHSVLGLIFVIVGLLTSELLVGFGLGVIMGHTIRTKEFVFIEKVKRGKE